MLPPLSARKTGKDYDVKPSEDEAVESTTAPGECLDSLTVGDLFSGFIGFYEREINLQCEAVSLRHGRRQPSSSQKSDDADSVDLGLRIQDPFDPERNCGASMSQEGLQRLREELVRADVILSATKQASLSEVLQPWAPPERHSSMVTEDALATS